MYICMYILCVYVHIHIYMYIRHTCLAQSASDCAKEVPQAPEKVAFGTFWAPVGFLWHSQRLTVPKKVCRFPMSLPKNQRK